MGNLDPLSSNSICRVVVAMNSQHVCKQVYLGQPRYTLQAAPREASQGVEAIALSLGLACWKAREWYERTRYLGTLHVPSSESSLVMSRWGSR